MNNKDIQAKKRARDRLAVTILNNYGTQIYESVLNLYHEAKIEVREIDKDINKRRYEELSSRLDKLWEICDLIRQYKDNN